MSQAVIGVIGGSGLYEIEQLTDIGEVVLDTPFGTPSDAYVTGMLEGVRIGGFFLLYASRWYCLT